MKKYTKLLFFFFILTFAAYANPIMEFYINEAKIDSSGWQIEFRNLSWRFQSLDSCYLTSTTDTVFFKTGIIPSDSFTVITADSLLNPLNINPNGDVIGFYEYNEIWIDELSFGNVPGWRAVSVPKPGQSICLYETYSPGYGQTYFYYLDNTPTLGSANDFINASGWVNGIVSDSLGFPIQGVDIEYDWHDFNGPYSVTSDSNGYFILNNYAKLKTFKISKVNYQTEFLPVQIYPEDTVTVNVTLHSVIDFIKSNSDIQLNTYTLSQNYPNPFNNFTTFNYTLPKNDFVEIAVYDLNGKLVEKLFSGQQNSGVYKVTWNAEKIASGVYIYQLKSTGYINFRKCLLIK